MPRIPKLTKIQEDLLVEVVITTNLRKPSNTTPKDSQSQRRLWLKIQRLIELTQLSMLKKIHQLLLLQLKMPKLVMKKTRPVQLVEAVPTMLSLKQLNTTPKD